MNAAELGKQIRARRKSMGLTIGHLARLTKLSKPTIGYLERAEKSSNNSTIIKVLKALDMPANDLKAEKPEWEESPDFETEVVKHIEQILGLSTVEGVTISIAGTDNGIAYAKTYRK